MSTSTWIDEYCNFCGAENCRLKRTADDKTACRACEVRYELVCLPIVK